MCVGRMRVRACAHADPPFPPSRHSVEKMIARTLALLEKDGDIASTQSAEGGNNIKGQGKGKETGEASSAAKHAWHESLMLPDVLPGHSSRPETWSSHTV